MSISDLRLLRDLRLRQDVPIQVVRRNLAVRRTD